MAIIWTTLGLGSETRGDVAANMEPVSKLQSVPSLLALCEYPLLLNSSC